MTFHVKLLPCVTFHVNLLPCCVTFHVKLLPCVTFHVKLFPCVTFHVKLLPCVTFHVKLLPCVTFHFKLLPCVTLHVKLLDNTGHIRYFSYTIEDLKKWLYSYHTSKYLNTYTTAQVTQKYPIRKLKRENVGVGEDPVSVGVHACIALALNILRGTARRSHFM